MRCWGTFHSGVLVTYTTDTDSDECAGKIINVSVGMRRLYIAYHRCRLTGQGIEKDTIASKRPPGIGSKIVG